MLGKKLILPSIVTNEALLFSPHESMKPDSRIVTLSNLLNEKMNLLTD